MVPPRLQSEIKSPRSGRTVANPSVAARRVAALMSERKGEVSQKPGLCLAERTALCMAIIACFCNLRRLRKNANLLGLSFGC